MSIKQQIIAEYLSGSVSYEQLAIKYDFGKTTVRRWVSQHRLQQPAAPAAVTLPAMPPTEKSQEELLKEVALLQAQLQQERLQVKLLNAIIDIAEQELSVPIRKKSGTRQSNE